jgi:hypothetical protein
VTHQPPSGFSSVAQLSSWSNRATAASLCNGTGANAPMFPNSVNYENDSAAIS